MLQRGGGSLSGKCSGVSFKVKPKRTTDPAIALVGAPPRNEHVCPPRDMSVNVLSN